MSSLEPDFPHIRPAAPASGTASGGLCDPHAPDPRVGSRVTHYRLQQRLGHGGMGVVYRATDLLLGRPVALKFLPPHLSSSEAARARFVREAKAASALDHVNVGAIHEIGQAEDGCLFIAMACYEGETLAQKIARGPMPVHEALDYALQIACGLRHAHEAGIIHRDVTPANVIVTEEGVAKVLDFGLAKVRDERLTQTGVTLGTARYMSPEQAQGRAVDARADLWSVGVVLYEMLTARPPFRGDYEPAVLYAVVHEEPEPLGGAVPEALAEVVRRCLQKNPADRYSDAAALVRDLRLLQSGALPAAGPVPPHARRRTAGRIRRGAVVVVLLAAVVVAAALLPRTARPGAGRQLLAVLPFETRGANEQTQMVAAGLQDVLSSKLTQVEAYSNVFSVLPASEITDRIKPSEAYARLRVALAVDGSVQATGARKSLIINLVNARTRETLASREVPFQEGDSSLVDRAFFSLLGMLKMQLEPPERARLSGGGASSPQAEQYYLFAQGLLQKAQSEDDAVAAAAAFASALEIDPRFARAEAGLGRAYWRRYDATADVQWADSALAHSRRALTLDDGLAEAYVAMGTAYQNQNRFRDAVGAFSQAIEIEPRNAEAYRLRGISYRSAGQPERAEADYLRAIALKPDYWRNYHSLATFYYLTGDFRSALDRYRQGLALAPDNVSMLNGLGAVQHSLLQFDDAIATFERILRLRPDFTNARANLATAYFYRGRYADAARMYQIIQASQPADYQALNNLADAHYWVAGARQQALREYRAAIDLARPHLVRNERDLWALSVLAVNYQHLSEPDSARAYLARLKAALPSEQVDGEVAFTIGEMHVYLGERQQGLAWMNRALAQGKGWSRALHSPWLKDLQHDPEYRQMLASHARPGAR